MQWWQRLVALEADLAATSEAVLAAQRAVDVGVLVDERAAEIGWADRCHGREVTLGVSGAGTVRGVLAMATLEWVLVHVDAATDTVVATDRITSVVCAASTPRTAAGATERRSRWRQAFTVLVEDAAPVQLLLVDGSHLAGVPVTAGRDYVEIADRLVPYAALVTVRCPR